MNSGKWRKKRLRPSHHHHRLRKALEKLRVPYKDYVCFYNKHGQLQYIDVIARTRGKTFAILWDLKHSKRKSGYKHSPKPYERRNWERKLEFLKDKGIPYLILDWIHTTDEYFIKVSNFINTLDKN